MRGVRLIRNVVLCVSATLLTSLSRPVEHFWFSTANDDGTLLWRRSGLQLFSRELANTYRDKYLVMVTFRVATTLHEQLRHDPRLLQMYQPPDTFGVGYALLQLPRQDRVGLDELAFLVHDAGGCGSMEPVAFPDAQGFNLVKSAEPTIYPPIYSDSIALSQAATLFSGVDMTKVQANIRTLVEQGTRFHSTPTGIATPAIVKSMFEAAQGSWPLQYELVDHNATFATEQKSVVASLAGTTEDTTTVILGAHLDSINRSGAAPGADDNASGTASLVEIARVLAASGATFRRRIEFHAYAAEEVTLKGSYDIASRYAKAGRKVAAMMQFDMNSYSDIANDTTIHLITNDTDPLLRRSLKNMLHSYLGGGFIVGTLSSGTSDHRSWTNQGYAAVFPFEHPTLHNKKIHTADDTMANSQNYAMTARFIKLGIAFLVHHAGLVSASASYAAAVAALTEPSLYVAVVEGKAGENHIAISAASDVASVEVCEGGLAAGGCTAAMPITMKAHPPAAAKDRSFFASDPVKAESSWLIRAYDSDDKLVGERSVKISPKA